MDLGLALLIVWAAGVCGVLYWWAFAKARLIHVWAVLTLLCAGGILFLGYPDNWSLRESLPAALGFGPVLAGLIMLGYWARYIWPGQMAEQQKHEEEITAYRPVVFSEPEPKDAARD